MKFAPAVNSILLLVIGIVIGAILVKTTGISAEGFQDAAPTVQCVKCGNVAVPPTCPPCRQPDMSKFVLRSSVPPCPPMPDLSKYMLKTECPPVPDLSNYVLKSSIPRQGPVVLDCSKCSQSKAECPPCPRPRCPEVKCPPPQVCPPCAPCERTTCPQPEVRCTARQNEQANVRPYLAPLDVRGFGAA